MKYLIEIDDEQGRKGRKIYLTSWGTSAWKIHAKIFDKKSDAKNELTKYLTAQNGEGGRVLNYET